MTTMNQALHTDTRTIPIRVLFAAPQLREVRKSLEAAGCQLQTLSISEITSTANLDQDSDILLVDLDDIGHLDVFAHLHSLNASHIPMVLITKEVDQKRQALCQKIGAMALLPDDVDSATLAASLRLWVERGREIKALRTSESHLQNALISARCISHATGVLAERHKISVNEAFLLLRSQAREARKRIEEIASEITAKRA
jgi:AmiR/NasT family two-component response regulator